MFGAKASLHSRREYEGTDGRAYEAVHPINQETLLLGADVLYEKVRVQVWRSWRGDPPSAEAFQPPLLPSTLVMRACEHSHTTKTQHSSQFLISSSSTFDPLPRRLHSSGLKHVLPCSDRH
jgi:hypothetical protein